MVPPVQGFLIVCRTYRRNAGGQIEAVLTLIFVQKSQTGQIMPKQYSFIEDEMELLIDLKKGSTGLRYVKELNNDGGNGGFKSSSVVYFTCSAFNKTTLLWTQALVSLDLKTLYSLPANSRVEGPSILNIAQQFQVYDHKVYDFLFLGIQSQAAFLAFTIDTGLLICHYPAQSFGNESFPLLMCEEDGYTS